jgi:hypothetical protein
VSDLSIDGPVPQVISSGLKLGGQGIHGGIQNGQLTLANGEVQNDFSLNIIRYVAPTPVAGQPDAGGTTSATPTDATGQQLVPISLPLGFSGGVSLTTGNLKNFVVSVPQGLLPSQYASLFPSGLTIPFTGTSSRPTLDTQKALTANAGGAILNGNGGGAGALLDGFLGKHKKQSQPQPTSQDSSGP